MKDAARIRIAAAVTTLFIGALAGTGVVLRNADNPTAPPSIHASRPAAVASATPPAAAGTQPQVAVSRVSPATGGSIGRAKRAITRQRHERQRGSEELYD
jgi:hypothetical protein